MVRLLLVVSGVCLVQSFAVTPIQKVVELLEGLESKVSAQGAAEAETYNSFACFCKDSTQSKSTAITEGKDSIESLSASIEEDSAKAGALQIENAKTAKSIEVTTATIAGLEKELANLRAAYSVSNADLTAAILALQNAIKSLEAGKPTSLLQVTPLVKAAALLHEGKRASTLALVHRVQDVPETDYEFHSHDILSTLNSLLEVFQERKTEQDGDFTKQVDALTASISSWQTQLSTLQAKLASDSDFLSDHQQAARENRASLVNAKAALEDDQLYLKDLTLRCEKRATEWDQRSLMRNKELKAIQDALKVLGGSSHLERERAPAALVQRHRPTKPASFLQVYQTRLNQDRFLQHGSSSQTDARERVIATLDDKSRQIGSSLLGSLAARLRGSADPFVKVKNIIQKLLERLLEEAHQENSQKGYCDTQTGKFNTERQFRKEEVMKLAGHLDKTLNELRLTKETILKLTDDLATRKAELATAVDLRATEHDENMKNIQESRDGIAAIKEAKQILHEFYRDARNQAPVHAFVQLQASPVDEDTAGPGFDGQYRGEQEQSTAIIGLLDVILTDFERSLENTQQEEKDANQAFEYYREESEAFIAKTGTDLQQRNADKERLEDTHRVGLDSISTAQGLLDDALRGLENLKALCVDTAMSAEERSTKRDAEIEALKQAHSALGGTDYVSPR